MNNRDLLLDYYKTEMLSIKQAHANGKLILAKPLLLVSVIDYIKQGACIDNKVLYNDLNVFYSTNTMLAHVTKTPMQYPYYYMKSESFWHLKWKCQFIKTKAPSAKFVRENIEYAYLDNALWDLLQEPQVQQQLREALVTHFLTR